MTNFENESNEFYFLQFIRKLGGNFNGLLESIKVRKVKNVPDKEM